MGFRAQELKVSGPSISLRRVEMKPMSETAVGSGLTLTQSLQFSDLFGGKDLGLQAGDLWGDLQSICKNSFAGSCLAKCSFLFQRMDGQVRGDPR